MWPLTLNLNPWSQSWPLDVDFNPSPSLRPQLQNLNPELQIWVPIRDFHPRAQPWVLNVASRPGSQPQAPTMDVNQMWPLAPNLSPKYPSWASTLVSILDPNPTANPTLHPNVTQPSP